MMLRLDYLSISLWVHLESSVPPMVVMFASLMVKLWTTIPLLLHSVHMLSVSRHPRML
jgi:hypothetical protein